MHLIIDHVPCEFVPIKVFRAAHDLPETFGVAFFQPKEYDGLGSIDGAAAGAALNRLRASLLSAVPDRAAAPDLLMLIDGLIDRFRADLYAINDAIGLRPEEVEFAIAGFADVIQTYAYGLLRARMTADALPSFEAVYANWLQDSVRVSGSEAVYHEGGRDWRVRIVSHVYGRVGLIVETGAEVHHVYDSLLACPAEGFMQALLSDVCAKLRFTSEKIKYGR